MFPRADIPRLGLGRTVVGNSERYLQAGLEQRGVEAELARFFERVRAQTGGGEIVVFL